jgi:hypothetical protein
MPIYSGTNDDRTIQCNSSGRGSLVFEYGDDEYFEIKLSLLRNSRAHFKFHESIKTLLTLDAIIEHKEGSAVASDDEGTSVASDDDLRSDCDASSSRKQNQSRDKEIVKLLIKGDSLRHMKNGRRQVKTARRMSPDVEATARSDYSTAFGIDSMHSK